MKCSWGKEGGGSQPSSHDSHYGGGGGGGYSSNQVSVLVQRVLVGVQSGDRSPGSCM